MKSPQWRGDKGPNIPQYFASDYIFKLLSNFTASLLLVLHGQPNVTFAFGCFSPRFSSRRTSFSPQLGTSWVFNVRKHICVLSASACAPSEKSSALQFMQIFHSDSSSTFEEDYNKQHQKRGLFKLSSPYLLE